MFVSNQKSNTGKDRPLTSRSVENVLQKALVNAKISKKGTPPRSPPHICYPSFGIGNRHTPHPKTFGSQAPIHNHHLHQARQPEGSRGQESSVNRRDCSLQFRVNSILTPRKIHPNSIYGSKSLSRLV